MNVNTIFKLLPAVVLSVITMENCQNMDKNENTKEEKNDHRNNYGTQKCPLLYIPTRGKGESRHHAESCYGGSLGCKQATLGF